LKFPSRQDRLLDALKVLSAAQPANNGLEAYAQLTLAINEVEDRVWSPSKWDLPRTFLDGGRTERLYVIQPESFFPVRGYPGVTLLLAKREVVFISRCGAIEFQWKDPNDPHGEKTHFAKREEKLFFERLDAVGDGVWHEKNRVP